MASEDFTFAVISDTHFQTGEAVRRSPYPSDARANDRARRVVEAVNRLEPEFVIHLGDVIHPLPVDREAQETAYGTAREILGELRAPLHVIPGNHDVGDRPGAWVPVPPVDEVGRRRFQEMWGEVPRSFDRGGCHLVLLDAPVMGSELEAAGGQRRWLEEDLARARDQGRRILLFAHYPPYLVAPGEDGSYDNLPAGARSWLLDTLERYAVEAVFTGHVHHFRYDRHVDTDLWVLPSIGFVRPEFSELWPVPPTAEFGRDDPDKLGFVLVRVEDDGYRVERIRAGGTASGFAAMGEPAGRPGGLLATPSDTAGASAPLGLTLRHPWARARPLSVGSLDELHRRRARDDEWLSGAMELGIRRLRIPLNEVRDGEVRARMRALAARGHRFALFDRGLPDPGLRADLERVRNLVESLELVVPTRALPGALEEIAALREELDLPLFLAPLALPTAEEVRAGAAVEQFPDPGFAVSGGAGPDLEVLAGGLTDGLTGVVFRVGTGVDPWAALAAAGEAAGAEGLEALAVVHLPRAPEGRIHDDDRAVAARAVETVLAARAAAGVRVYLDAYVDYDRAYLPRRGLLDRRGNPRAGQRALHRLRSWLGGWDPEVGVRGLEAGGGVRARVVEDGPVAGVVLLVDGEVDRVVLAASSPLARSERIRAVDLCAGGSRELSAASGGDGDRTVLEGTLRAGPWLLVSGS